MCVKKKLVLNAECKINGSRADLAACLRQQRQRALLGVERGREGRQVVGLQVLVGPGGQHVGGGGVVGVPQGIHATVTAKRAREDHCLLATSLARH